jgi:phenylacetate-coenzyme A ligase PaaK-like adenylate-forming protein
MTTKKPAKRKPRSNGHVTDGELAIQVKGGRLDGKTVKMDLTIVKLCSEPLEKDLEVVDGFLQATPQFAMALNEALQAVGYDCTPTIAVKAWIQACEFFAEQQKKTSSRRS